MGLRKRTILILATTIMLAAISISMMSRFFYLGRLEGIELREAEEAVRRAGALVDEDLEQLDVLTRDWAFWDDSWKFMASRDPAFLESNLSDGTTVELLGLSAFLMLDMDGKIVVERTGEKSRIEALAPLPRLLKDRADSYNGLVKTGGEFHLAAMRPILRSDGTGTSRGFLLMTRLVDPKRLQRYSRLAGMPVSLGPFVETGKATLPQNPKTAFIPAVKQLAAVEGDEIGASLPFAGPDGLPVANIGIKMKRLSVRYGTTSILPFLSGIVLVIAAIGMVAVILFETMVLGRMKRIGTELERIASLRPGETRLAENGSDELATLERAINKTLDSLYSLIGERDAALREVHHRVKNNLQVIASLLSLQATRSEGCDPVSSLRESQRRVLSIASVHEELYTDKAIDRVNLKKLLERLVSTSLQTYETIMDVRTSIESHDHALGIDRAVSLGLVVSEALSNCFRHAFRDRRSGCIRIAASEAASGGIILRIDDDGIGLAEDFERGLGLELIGVLAKQLKAEFSVVRGSLGGTSFMIELPPEP